MSYLMIDSHAASRVGAGLLYASGRIETVQAQVLAAASLADIEVAAFDLLAGLDELLRVTGRQLLVAGETAAGFRLPAIAVLPATPWNEVRQLASHNSYAHPGAIDDLYARGIRSFELDVHRGDPTDFAPTFESVGSWFGRVVADAVDHDGDWANDWRVYHHSLDTPSAYSWLSDGLATIAALPTTDPITVFVDNKDRFADGHSDDVFDDLLVAHLGARLYRPADLLARSPGATTLGEAVEDRGWPTARELQGRVIVVLTDEVASYRRAPLVEQAAFVAQVPAGTDDANAVFFNASGKRVTAEAIEDLQRRGRVVRVWNGGPDHVNANYLAVDRFTPQPD